MLKTTYESKFLHCNLKGKLYLKKSKKDLKPEFPK
jgi:hypothetical protein